MSISYKYEPICNGADYTEIIDERFKTNYINISLIDRMDKNTASANYVIPLILKDTNEKYPSMTSLSRKLSSLYDASILSDVSKIGDLQSMSLVGWTIADKYTINGENISSEVIDILLDCLTKPCLENGCFPEEYFRLKKNELIDDIRTVVNNKRRYASLRTMELTYAGEPAGINVEGTRETAEKLTSEDVYKRYKELLKTAYIKVVFSGHDISEENKQKLFDRIRSLDRDNIIKTDISASPLKPAPEYCTEQMEVTQAVMSMVFKPLRRDIPVFAMKLLSAVYGGTPFSMLFDNVRERLSLCYYCSSWFAPVKNVMVVNSGVEFDNITAAQKEINAQLEHLCSGDIPEKIVDDTKRYVKNALKSTFDRPAALANYFMKQQIIGTDLTPEKEAQAIDAVTAEEIIEAAKDFRLDTVYVLTGKDNDTNE